MNISLFISISVVFIFVSFWISLQSSKKTKTHKQYFLAEKKLGIFSLFLTLLATQVGGGAIIGTAELAYFYGERGIYYSLGIAGGFVVLATGVGRKFNELNLSSIPEIFEFKTGSKVLRQICAFASVMTLFLILTAIFIAARKFYYYTGLENNFIYFAFMLLLVVYTSLGGLQAVVKTDIFQVGFLICVFIVCVCYSLSFNFDTVLSSLSVPVAVDFGHKDLLMPFMFTLIGQDMGQRCFAAKSKIQLTIASILASIFMILISLVPYYYGIMAKKDGLMLANDTCLIMEILAYYTSPSIAALFACSILAAILSTADSLLCSISLNLNYDILHVKSKNLLSTKLLTVFLGVISLFISFLDFHIIPLMVFAYEIFVITFFLPIITLLFIKKMHIYTLYISIFSSVFFLSINYFLSLNIDTLSYLSCHSILFIIFNTFIVKFKNQ